MKKISEIITEDLFINAFTICQSYCKKKDQNYLVDINLRLLRESLIQLTLNKVKTYYERYIKTDLVYSLPELFASDIVSIPKSVTGVREYRFFSVFSLLLYNAVGLFFASTCSDMIAQLKFKRKNINAYYPTKFTKDDKGVWNVKNEYRNEYKKFLKNIEDNLNVNDIVLCLDISQYFESINHNRLISLIREYTSEALLKKHNYDKDSHSILEFYFRSLMSRQHSIPQGKKNFVSDYFGYLYLMPFDITLNNLVGSDILKFKSMIRYVDDIFIIFERRENLQNSDIFKELHKIETTIASWLYKELNLLLNTTKTRRWIVSNDNVREKFIETTKKTVSTRFVDASSTDTEIEEKKRNFINILDKFQFTNGNSFNFSLQKNDIENLKLIFDSTLKNYLLKSNIQTQIKTTLDSFDFELSTDYINIIIVLFFISDKNYPFKGYLEQFLKKETNFNDKRHIHIFLNSLIHETNLSAFKKRIEKFRSALREDNYGKYLLTFFALTDIPENFDCLSDESIYYKISQEYTNKKYKPYFSHYKTNNPYVLLIEKLIKKMSSEESIIRQIKYYVCYYRNEDWDQAFNYLHNVFHGICKIKFNLKDKDSLTEVLNKLTDISLDEEIKIIKFYQRRNFNLVTHPGQKSTPSVKVTKEDLLYYAEKILPLANYILD